MYELNDNGDLVTTLSKPYESAGYIYYYKAPDETTKVILFNRYNKDKQKNELELGTFGKSDFGLIKDNDKASMELFVAKVKALGGQELPRDTALREGSEETNGVITTPPPALTLPPSNKLHYDIITDAHKCWCDVKKIQTIVSIVPYELNKEQYQALLVKEDYTNFTGAVEADLKISKDGKVELISSSTNLLAEENLQKWRRFNQNLLSESAYRTVINEVFTNMLNKPSPVHENKEVKEKLQSQTKSSSWRTPALIAGGVLGVGVLCLVGLYAKQRGAPSTVTPPEPVPTNSLVPNN